MVGLTWPMLVIGCELIPIFNKWIKWRLGLSSQPYLFRTDSTHLFALFSRFVYNRSISYRSIWNRRFKNRPFDKTHVKRIPLYGYIQRFIVFHLFIKKWREERACAAQSTGTLREDWPNFGIFSVRSSKIYDEIRPRIWPYEHLKLCKDDERFGSWFRGRQKPKKVALRTWTFLQVSQNM